MSGGPACRSFRSSSDFAQDEQDQEAERGRAELHQHGQLETIDEQVRVERRTEGRRKGQLPRSSSTEIRQGTQGRRIKRKTRTVDRFRTSQLTLHFLFVSCQPFFLFFHLLLTAFIFSRNDYIKKHEKEQLTHTRRHANLSNERSSFSAADRNGRVFTGGFRLSSSQLILFGEHLAIGRVFLVEYASMLQRNEEQPHEQKRMDDPVDADSRVEHDLIELHEPRARSDARVRRVQEDQCTDDRVPNGENDQDEQTHDGVLVHRCQVGDRWLEDDQTGLRGRDEGWLTRERFTVHRKVIDVSRRVQLICSRLAHRLKVQRVSSMWKEWGHSLRRYGEDAEGNDGDQ